jgi:bacterioferritin-associated ferredoxin
MIVCSCNVFSDHQVRSALAEQARPRMSQVYAYLGCHAQCGRCTHTIKRIMDEMPSYVINQIAGGRFSCPQTSA